MVLDRKTQKTEKSGSGSRAILALIPGANFFQVTFFMTLVNRLDLAELPFGNIAVPGVGALDDPAERHFNDRAGMEKVTLTG